MGHGRGKFSFPIPGKKATKKADHDTDDAASIPSVRSAHEWPSRLDEPTSKAHRILGTSEPIHRSVSRQTSGVPASPGFVSVSVSEASFGSDLEHKSSRAMTDLRPAISRRASSNVMGHAYSGDERRGSDYSTTTHRLQPQTSNSTMRSHYDAKSSPLAISQQTSDSAVRDMALRRGKPKVVADYGYSAYVASPLSPVALEQAKERANRKGKPARLDLSKLFPKPKTGDSRSNSNALLSPNKLVSSPAAMSTMSDFPFPRPMTREPTPNPRGNVKLKPTSRPHTSVPPTPSSPVRKFKRDEYDNAKVHVRRPPKGVQHWFDALDEDSDEVTEENNTPLYAPKAMRPPHIPIRKASAGRLAEVAMMSQPSSRPPRSVPLMPRERGDTFSHDDLVNMERLTSPSQYSLASNKTKESALSKTNLQDSSVLSFSSSEDEADAGMSKTRKVAVRKSLDNYDAGEIIIGQAQAFEVRPHRRPSAAQMSTRSTSTSAATIEVMYTPEPPFTPMHYPRYSSSTSRRSSHHRQPSVIHEDEDARPMTAVNMPLSPSSHSVRSARTSTSEPKPRSNNGKQKMMAVTAEEEMLLELMRKKRASMAKKGLTQEDFAAMEQDKLQMTPVQSSRKPYRTSGFLAEASPVRVVDTTSTRKPAAVPPSPLHLAPRGRPRKAHYDSTPRESSTSDAWSDHHSSPARHSALPPHLPTPSEFSPIDLYPPSSPTPTASVTSPTTTDHASPLPSPVTPGLRAYENDVNVKVASSDTSTENEEVSVLDTGVIDAPASEPIKSSDSTCSLPQHTRRRTASSGTDVSFPIPPTTGLTDLPPVSEGSASRASSIVEQVAAPRLPRKNSRRVNDLAKATARPRSRQSSTHSSHSQQSLVSHTSSYVQGVSDKRTSRRVSRQSSATSMNNKRSSVSDDVLAAWGSLGGTY